MSLKKILVITPFESDGWSWFSPDFKEYEWNIKTLNLFSKKSWLWVFSVLPLIVQILRADLVVSHHPQMSLSVAIWMRLLRIKTPHLAYSFNHGNGRFFIGLHGVLAKWAFKNIWGVIVFSEAEKKIYSSAYEIPHEKFSFTHWAVRDPEIDEAWWVSQSFDKKYVCSLGRNNRDWPLLLEVAKSIPVNFVLVCNKESLKGLDIPGNVTVLNDLTSAQCSAVVRGAIVNVVPILDDSRGTGHITVVNSMKLGIPLVIANNPTLRDYFFDGLHGHVYSVKNSKSLENAIKNAILESEQSDEFSRQCRYFSGKWFTEAASRRSLNALLLSVFNGAAYPPSSPPSWVGE